MINDLISIIGTCECLTKTPDIRYHKKDCRYRIISERNTALALLNQSLNTLKTCKWVTIDVGRKMKHYNEELVKETLNEIKHFIKETEL